MKGDVAAGRVTATVTLARAGAPKELHVKLRLPEQYSLGTVTVNGQPVKIGGLHKDTVIIAAGRCATTMTFRPLFIPFAES